MKDITFEFEITQRCNNNCLFCYNVWKLDAKYPEGELETSDIKRLLKKIIYETNSRHIIFSGGEPLLRDDITEIISFASGLGFRSALITNGTLLSPEKIERLIESGVSLFETQILSSSKDIHDYLCGNNAFEQSLKAICEIKKQKSRVIPAFVATRKNIKEIGSIFELISGLGIDELKFNRFNPGGAGLRHIKELFITQEELIDTVKELDRLAAKFKIKVFFSIPIQPCIIDLTYFKNLNFNSYCTAGEYYTIDSLGNLRVCSHSPIIIGDLKTAPFSSLVSSSLLEEFKNAYPPSCSGCNHLKLCQGGCKAAAQVCYGTIYDKDPILTEGKI